MLMRMAPKVALLLQISLGALVILAGIFSLIAVRSDAQQHAGPPYYLLFEILFGFIAALLCLAAILMLSWKRVSWWFAIFLDTALALVAAYAAISDIVCKTSTPLGFDLTLLGIAALFGLIAALLVSQPSRTFFGVSVLQ